MTIFEAEDYVANNFEDYTGEDFVLEEADTYTIYLNEPAFVFSNCNIVCYEGYLYDKEEDQVDFCLTAVFEDDEYQYWEQDGVYVTLHNYFAITNREVNLDELDCCLDTRENSSLRGVKFEDS